MATQDDLDALDAAIRSGVKSVRNGETSTEFQSLADMLKAREMMAAELGTTTTRKRRVAKFDRGL
jgi:adenylosuccinate synthase